MRAAYMAGLIALLIGARTPAAGTPDLDWLAGYWCAQDGGRSSEEYWLPARGGIMLGMNRSITAKGTSFEFLRIEFSGGGARLLAQPGGAPATRFELVDAAPNKVTFANPAHDFPKRIHYFRDGASLIARTDGGAGDAQPVEFKWKRCEAEDAVIARRAAR